MHYPNHMTLSRAIHIHKNTLIEVSPRMPKGKMYVSHGDKCEFQRSSSVWVPLLLPLPSVQQLLSSFGCYTRQIGFKFLCVNRGKTVALVVYCLIIQKEGLSICLSSVEFESLLAYGKLKFENSFDKCNQCNSQSVILI